MEVFNLELRLTATEGSLHNLPTLCCLAWLTANNDASIPLFQDPGKAAVLTRPEGGFGPLAAHEPHVPNAPLGEVVALMRLLGLPGRTPRVQARSGGGLGSQNIDLEIRLGAEQGRLALPMDYAGLEGEDAGPCIQMLTHLFGLLGVSYLSRWVDPHSVQTIGEAPVPEPGVEEAKSKEKDGPMDFDTERVRPALEAWSPAVPDGMVTAVIGLIREAVEAERQACLRAVDSVELDYRDRPGILVKQAVIAALEKKAERLP